jgi:hypothetical protein
MMLSTVSSKVSAGGDEADRGGPEDSSGGEGEDAGDAAWPVHRGAKRRMALRAGQAGWGILAADASRHAALLVAFIHPVCALLATLLAGASTPKCTTLPAGPYILGLLHLAPDLPANRAQAWCVYLFGSGRFPDALLLALQRRRAGAAMAAPRRDFPGDCRRCSPGLMS